MNVQLSMKKDRPCWLSLAFVLIIATDLLINACVTAFNQIQI